MKTLKFYEEVESERLTYRMLVMKCFPHEVLTNNGMEIDIPRSFRKNGTVPVPPNMMNAFFLPNRIEFDIYKFSGGFEIESSFNNDEGAGDENFAFPCDSYVKLPFKLKLYFDDKSILLFTLSDGYHDIKIPLKFLK